MASRKIPGFVPYSSVCYYGHIANQWKGTLNSLGKSRAKEVHRNSREDLVTSPGKTSGLNKVQKIHRERQNFHFIKIYCLRFLWPELSLRFTIKQLPFFTVSRWLFLLNVFGNVTDSSRLCGAIHDVNETCKSRSRTRVREEHEHSAGDEYYYTFHYSVPATVKHSFSALSHSMEEFVFFLSINYT